MIIHLPNRSRQKIFTIVTFLGVVMLQTTSSQAQNVGVEAGVAAVENYSANPNFGLSLSWDINKRLTSSLTFSKWSGEDGNYTTFFNNPHILGSASDYYGDKGLNLMLWYKPIAAEKFSAALGAGFGQYERFQVDKINQRSTWFEDALTTGLLLRYQASPHLAPYFKSTLGIPSGNGQPRWGFFNVGVEFKPF